ncbi:PLD nuclease N-terminal domain-containing protein [Brevibacterium pigmentatum]|uniref:PLD nuclease N-terminal domain-containing protein n=1 Tax=Brevibacterium pigmentatum TaxID=1496080 RepID=UPI0038994E74
MRCAADSAQSPVQSKATITRTRSRHGKRFGVGWDVLWLSIFALLVVFLVAALVSINKSSLDAVTKLVWAVLALLFPIIGPVVWFVDKSSNRSSVPPRTRAQQ